MLEIFFPENIIFNLLEEACVLSGWIKVTLSQNLPGVWIISDLTVYECEYLSLDHKELSVNVKAAGDALWLVHRLAERMKYPNSRWRQCFRRLNSYRRRRR